MKVYTVDSKRQDTLKKYKPVKSIDEARLIDGQLSILDNVHDLSHTNNNTPTSILNEEDEDLEDDSNSFGEEESFPLDFTTKKLINIQTQEKPTTNELNSTIKVTINGDMDKKFEKINNETPKNNTSNESKSDDHPMEEENKFTSSLHKFMQFGQLNQIDSTIDWNNNSLPDTTVHSNLIKSNNKNAKFINELPGADDLNALNLIRLQENDGSRQRNEKEFKRAFLLELKLSFRKLFRLY